MYLILYIFQLIHQQFNTTFTSIKPNAADYSVSAKNVSSTFLNILTHYLMVLSFVLKKKVLKVYLFYVSTFPQPCLSPYFSYEQIFYLYNTCNSPLISPFVTHFILKYIFPLISLLTLHNNCQLSQLLV